MLSEGDIVLTKKYISDRHCPSGGYCFYQLDEPNLSDTWYALGSLTSLKEKISDELTERYINKPYPHGHGSIELFRTWYQYWAYKYLEISCPLELQTRINDLTPPIARNQGTMESSSALEQLYYYTILLKETDSHRFQILKAEIIQAVRQWHHQDGGFGRNHSTLIETWHAVSILIATGAPVNYKETARFVSACSDNQTGFVNVPGMKPGYLEHLDAGIRLSALLQMQIEEPELCTWVISKCRNANGGYTRSVFGGNSTLEYTWYALRSLTSLNTDEIWRW